jgi:hypothetical protein
MEGIPGHSEVDSPTVSVRKPHPGPIDLSDTIPLEPQPEEMDVDVSVIVDPPIQHQDNQCSSHVFDADEMRQLIQDEHHANMEINETTLESFELGPADWLVGFNEKSRLWAIHLENKGIRLNKSKGHYIVNNDMMDDFDDFKYELKDSEFDKRFKSKPLTTWMNIFRPSNNYKSDGEFVFLDRNSAREFDVWKSSFLDCFA